MNQEIEIEFKNVVSKTDFLHLCEIFSIEKSAFQKQVNHYFDTKEMQLKKNDSALRIREKQDTYTMTLKQPNEIGLLETHQFITKEEAHAAFLGGPLPKGTIGDQLYNSFALEITTCQYLGSLTTFRAEIEYLGGVLVFDHSLYFHVEDFEIEYEVKDEEKGKEIFKHLFTNYKIPLRKTDNKIKRFFLKKLEQD